MLFCVAGASASLEQTAAAASTCTTGESTDFNGDGIGDFVAADPKATVEGAERAGLVRVVFGGGKGVSEISQATAGMGASPERGDEFGFSRAVYDADGDGCTDLVVGAPYEDVPKDGDSIVSAGGIWVIHGSPAGIGAGSRIESYTQAKLDPSTVTEAYDRFGYALAAGSSAETDDPYLLVGVPGENITVDGELEADAGGVHYVSGSVNVTLNQRVDGVPGVVEAHDRFGYSLAATDRYFAVGVPGEAIGDAAFAGGVGVFSHQLTDGAPTPLAGLDQAKSGEGISGMAETGDAFGTSIAMTGYRPAGRTHDSDALLAIGVPAEDIDGVVDAGSATVIRVEPDGSVSEVAAMSATTPDVEGEPQEGDFFGQRVTIANTEPGSVTGADSVRLAVGIPGKEAGSSTEAGAVHVFRPFQDAFATSDAILSRAPSGSVIPGTATTRDYLGVALASNASDLQVGIPYSKAEETPRGVLHIIPWSDIDGSTAIGTTTLKPGSGGIPDAGTSFGVVG